MNIRYPLYEGVYRILTLGISITQKRHIKNALLQKYKIIF